MIPATPEREPPRPALGRPQRESLRIAMLYCLLALGWIFGSDLLLRLLVDDGALRARFEPWKGASFVLITGLLLLFLLHGLLRRLDASHAHCKKVAAEYRLLFEAHPHPMWVFDCESLRFMAVNDAAIAHYGYSREEFLTMTIRDIRPPEDLVTLEAYIHHGRCGYQPPTLWRHRRKDGSLLDVEILAHRTRFDGRNAELVLVHDVTERRRAEQQARLAACAFDHSQDTLFMTDDRGVIVAVNRAFTATTGYTAQEAIGQRPQLLLQSGVQGPAFYRGMWRSLLKEGRWQGEVWNRRRDGSLYPSHLSIGAVVDDAGRTTHYVGVSSDLSERKRTEEQLYRLAFHDPLTGLPNRSLLQRRVAGLIDGRQTLQTPFALLFIELDHFKTINDSLGHAAGDALLQQAAKRLRELAADTALARWGADEFALILPEADADQAARTAQQLLEQFSQAFEIDHHRPMIGASIGISLYPRDGEDAESLLRNADVALFRAKTQRRGSMQFFHADMTAAAMERLLIEAALRTALRDGGLEVHYQPQLRITSAVPELVGFEALVRWRHPERGFIPPAHFIPIAEQCGLIGELGRWVLHTACREMSAWRTAGRPEAAVSVNLSAAQLKDGSVVDDIRGVLHATALPALCLVLEVTESTLLDDTEATMIQLDQLREIGVQLAIDDFGTGYSSLAYLKRLPVSHLKIDRSFVSDLTHDANARSIAQAIIGLGHTLKMCVIAEGVETQAQCELLRELGCDKAQGYLFSPALPAGELAGWLQRFTAARPDCSG